MSGSGGRIVVWLVLLCSCVCKEEIHYVTQVYSVQCMSCDPRDKSKQNCEDVFSSVI